MKLASTLTAVGWFFQVLLDESLAFAIQHWGRGGFDDDPGLPNALHSMSTAMSNVLEQLNLAQIVNTGENEGVHEYLKNLKDAAYAADDLLSELDYYRLHQQVEASEIDSAMKESATRSFSHLLLTNQENQASEELARLLLPGWYTTTKKSRTILTVGYGCAFLITLMLPGLQREILEDLGVYGFDHTTNLQSERYLLILDDVWNDSEGEKWGSLCALLRSQKAGSRILMTTRLNTVVSIAAKNMDMLDQCQLGGLPEDKYLSLFNICAFGDENPMNHLSLVKIGNQIAGKLKGSPLAAKTVGGLLRENLDEDHWRSVLNSDIWQLPQSHNDIMPVLQLSYQHLAPHLQQCFTYCGVFPKDWVFQKDKLIAMWISHGYIGTKSSGNKSVEEIGSEYFDNLLSRSFIQASHGVKYVLHDLLHDLAESVSKNEYLKINSKQTKEITSSVRHLHAHSNDLSLLKSCNLRNLRTLIIDGNKIDDYIVVKEVLNGLKSIRVLSLNVSVKLLSDSIGHLIHLRYLTVNTSHRYMSPNSHCRPYNCQYLTVNTNDRCMSPDSQCRPYHLQWLIFESNALATDPLVLPAATNYLVSLRHFLFVDSPYLDRWEEISRMSGIGKLICLQELRSFRVGKNEGEKLAELKRLNELGGTLRLNSLDNASTKEEALEANLNKKVGIRKLMLACDDGHATPQMAKEVFEGLHPPPYINDLTLIFYLGVESPTWMVTENHCLSYLQSLKLWDCLKLKDLPPLGQLPFLRQLEIYRAHTVEEVGSSFYGSGVAKYFPCLETLDFHDMPEWVVWSGVKDLFPQLCELTVTDCPKLKRVPLQCLSPVEVLETNCSVLLAEHEKPTSLKQLIIHECHEIQSLALLPASLVTLEIKFCSQLLTLFTTESEYGLSKLTSLRELVIGDCGRLVSAELKSLPSLQKLRIEWCERIQSVPLLPATLEEVAIQNLPMLTAFSREQEKNLSDLTSLRKIRIQYCPQLHSLPLMPASLQELYIKDCPELQWERYQEGGDDWHKISHVLKILWDCF